MIQVIAEIFSPSDCLAQLEQTTTASGAVVSFTGRMRAIGESGDELSSLYLEHYPGMTEKALQTIYDRALEQFDIESVQIIHRVGIILPNEPIVFVAAVSMHRQPAFDAVMMIMDVLKNRAPFWKKEIYLDGTERWVEQKTSDRESINQWLD